MSNTPNQMYFKISDSDAVASIDQALAPVCQFDEKLHSLQKKYGADSPFVFNSSDDGLQFSHLWFKEYPNHLDTNSEFKVSTEKGKEGFEVRPRKANKKFYEEFNEGLLNVDYSEFKQVLFADTKARPNIEYKKVNQCYLLSSTQDIVVAYEELTASQYNQAIK